MRILRPEMSGSDVIAWQHFLIGATNSHLIATGQFDVPTLELTKKFQLMCGLDSDGVVGPMTFAKAQLNGYNQFVDESDDKFSKNWPKKPDNVKSLSPQERAALFGTFSYSVNDNGSINIDPRWIANNIISVQIPQLASIQGGTVMFHRLVEHQLIKFFQDIEDANLLDRIKTWGGSWVPRLVRGSSVNVSNHAWGTAFDINVQWNMLGAQPALFGKNGCVRELVEIGINNGFYWGGYFPTRLDGMHFEIFKVIPKL